jgi:hypothetical protein
LDVDEVCVVVKADVLCSPVNVLDDAAEKLAESMVKLVDEINKFAIDVQFLFFLLKRKNNFFSIISIFFFHLFKFCGNV